MNPAALASPSPSSSPPAQRRQERCRAAEAPHLAHDISPRISCGVLGVSPPPPPKSQLSRPHRPLICSPHFLLNLYSPPLAVSGLLSRHDYLKMYSGVGGGVYSSPSPSPARRYPDPSPPPFFLVREGRGGGKGKLLPSSRHPLPPIISSGRVGIHLQMTTIPRSQPSTFLPRLCLPPPVVRAAVSAPRERPGVSGGGVEGVDGVDGLAYLGG